MKVLSIGRKKRIHAIAFSPSGTELATACGDGQLRLWDLATGEVRLAAPLQETSCGYDLLYLDEDRLLLAGSDLQWWDIPANAWNLIREGRFWRGQMRLSPDGRYFAEADEAETGAWNSPGLLVRDTQDWGLLPMMPDARLATSALAFSPDSRLLASGHMLLAGQRPRRIASTLFASPDYEYVVRVREMPSGAVIREIGGWQQSVRNLAFSPDGSFLAGTAGPRLRVWDLVHDREVALHKRGTKHFQALVFTARGSYAATVSNDETVRVWDTSSWQEHTTITWEIGKMLNLAFAADGLRAAAGGDRGQVVIWDWDLGV